MSTTDRGRDLLALTLVVAGAALYVYAHRGMRSLAAGDVQGDLTHPLMTLWDRYSKLSRGGLVVAGIGVAVGLWSFIRHAVRRPAIEP